MRSDVVVLPPQAMGQWASWHDCGDGDDETQSISAGRVVQIRGKHQIKKKPESNKSDGVQTYMRSGDLPAYLFLNGPVNGSFIL